MLIIEHSIKTKATPEAIWSIWEDVENWPSWDHGIESSKIYGPFAVGTKGILKPKGGPAVKTELIEVNPKQSFVDKAKLPFAKIIVSHHLKQEGATTIVTHRIDMKGPLVFVFAILIGRGMRKNLPGEMKALINKAENSA